MKAKSGSLDFSAIQLQMQLCCYNRKARDGGGKERGQSCFSELKQCALVAKKANGGQEVYHDERAVCPCDQEGQWCPVWPMVYLLAKKANVVLVGQQLTSG